MLESIKDLYKTSELDAIKVQAIEASSSGIVISDMSLEDNPLIYINAAFEVMTGYSREEVIGKNCRFLQGGDKDQPEIDELRRAIKAEESTRVILKNYKKDGTLFWNELIISPVKDDDGKLTNFIGIQTDVTARVEAQMALKEKTQELEISNKDLEQFAHAVSHDLKEPLRMIATFIEFLSDEYSDKLDEKAQDYINYAIGGANRMQSLIEDLLVFSKVKGQADSEFEMIDLNEVIEEILVNLKVLITEKNAKIDIENLPSLKANKSQILVLLQNLISNALKYSAKEPRIILKAKTERDRNLISVEDNGIGIDDHYKDYVFEIFNRLHSKKTYPGNGIGLSICKRVVDNHGGEIWFESEKEKGTKFFVAIPKNL